MMDLMDGGRRRRRHYKREPLEMAALTALSVGAAMVLLPAIGLKVLTGKLSPVRNVAGGARGPEEHYLNT